MGDFPAHYKHMASRGVSVSAPQASLSLGSGPARFQELPRLQVPAFALSQQAPAVWKAPQPAPPPPSRMSVSNILSFRRSNSSNVPVVSAVPQAPPSPQQQPVAHVAPVAPTRRLPSFQEILARTSLLNIMSRSSEPEPAAEPAVEQDDEEQMAVDNDDMQQQQEYQQHWQYQHHQQQFQYGQYQMDANVAMEATSADEQAAFAATTVPASPASQVSESNKRRERWTEEEHALFMEGLNRYGRKWKKIQTYVKTKTAVQVRTHAYGYFAKLLRNMPEDDAIWELAEEMSSLPGAVLKGPGNGKRRNEPKTDEQGMEVLRRFVFSKKKTDEAKKLANAANSAATAAVDDSNNNVEMAEEEETSTQAETEPDNNNSNSLTVQPMQPEAPAPAPRRRGWPFWGASDSSQSSEMELKRQRLS